MNDSSQRSRSLQKWKKSELPKKKRAGEGWRAFRRISTMGWQEQEKKGVGRANPIPIEAKWTQAHMNSLEQTRS